MKLGFLFGWGVVLYSIMYLAWSGVVLYGLSESLVARLLMLALLVAVATLAGRSLALERWEDILPYSATWLTMTFMFDIVFAAQLNGFEIFLDPSIWMSYALILFVPLLAPHSRARP